MNLSTEMLRKLGSGVRPGPSAGAGGAGRAPAESQRFEELLAAAKVEGGVGAGVFRSEPVRLAKHSKVELSAEQLGRMGSAVDAAEAQGSHTLLAFIDGQGVIVDVASRTVSGVAKPGSGVVGGVDAVAVIPDAPVLPAEADKVGGAAEAEAVKPGLLALPSTESIRNADLSRLLGMRGSVG